MKSFFDSFLFINISVTNHYNIIHKFLSDNGYIK